MNEDDIRAAGTKVRRRILGDAHVDRAVAGTTPVTRDFQDLVTRYVWGEIWTRPGFDYRTRRILVMGTMLALGRWEEFKLHVRSALADGFSLADLKELMLQHQLLEVGEGEAIGDLKELMLQQAVYCGVPAANTGNALVSEVMAELRGQGVKIVGDES